MTAQVNMVEVESSNVKSVGHDGADLYVEFVNSTRYVYRGVSSGEFDRLIKAPSVGKHLNAAIKPNYRVERLS